MRRSLLAAISLSLPLFVPIGAGGAEPKPADRLATLQAMLARHPHSGGILWDLAVARLGNGDAAGSIRDLRRAYDAGLELNLEAPELAPLKSDPAFVRLREAVRKSRPPLPAGPTAFTIPEKDLVPEGIVFDPADGSFYVGSIPKRKIVRVSREGSVSDLVGPAGGIRGSVLGLRVDSERRRLWAATVIREGRPKDRASSALLLVDLPSGRLRASFEAPDDGKHLFNDIALLGDGTAFVTDSDAGTVYRVGPADSAPSAVLPRDSFRYPNGIALAPDGRSLFVADALDGVTLLDPATGKRVALPRAAGISLEGIDGLYTVPGGLVAVQNGTGVDRVAWFGLDRSGKRVVSVKVLSRADPRFHIPTTGAVAPDGLYLLANSSLDALDDDDAPRPGREPSEPLVVKVPLPVSHHRR